MPKGVPKTEGEKLKDKFDKSYKKMKTSYKKGDSRKGKGKSKCACDDKDCKDKK